MKVYGTKKINGRFVKMSYDRYTLPKELKLDDDMFKLPTIEDITEEIHLAKKDKPDKPDKVQQKGKNVRKPKPNLQDEKVIKNPLAFKSKEDKLKYQKKLLSKIQRSLSNQTGGRLQHI
jgi:hypothetical protein